MLIHWLLLVKNQLYFFSIYQIIQRYKDSKRALQICDCTVVWIQILLLIHYIKWSNTIIIILHRITIESNIIVIIIMQYKISIELNTVIIWILIINIIIKSNSMMNLNTIISIIITKLIILLWIINLMLKQSITS